MARRGGGPAVVVHESCDTSPRAVIGSAQTVHVEVLDEYAM